MYEIPEIDWKKQKKREKIGVIVFVLGILAIFLAVFLYISIGHNLDLTASHIDNQVGQLNGYSTIIFEGDSKKINDGKFIQDTDENKQYELANLDNVQKYYRDKSSTTCKIKCCDYSAYEEGEIFQRGEWKIGVISINQNILNDALKSKIDQIAKEKQENKNPLLPDNTDESKNNKQKSLTSTNVKTKTPQMINLQKKIDNLYVENKADIVIVVAPHQDILDLIDHVDCVIANKCYQDIDTEGKNINSTYVMPVPANDCIGAILSSPAKMLSAKVFQKIEIKQP